MLWIDILIMPELEQIGVILLNKNWLIGELALIIFVFIPSYFWAYASYNNKFNGLRALFQIIVMVAFFLVGLPFFLQTYQVIDLDELGFEPLTFQLFLIITFPSLVAVLDLVKKGEGTPFPFDPTKKLVKTGVYAYCRNPIQWSFTWMFIPLSIYSSSYYFLLGSISSIAYVFGVSDHQESDDMKKRFGSDWVDYQNNVPKWLFLWRPKGIPEGVVFFDTDCDQCSQIRSWFLNSRAINLNIKPASEFPGEMISQVTYVDSHGAEYKSINAIACCLEHINLAYATLGWFMRFPVINLLLQLIIDTMEFGSDRDQCEIE